MTVTPYERIAIVTVLHVNYEVPQSVVAVALGRYGRVLSQHMPTYLEYPTVKTGVRQFRIDLKEDIPSFLYVAGLKAHVRYRGQPPAHALSAGIKATRHAPAPTCAVPAVFVLDTRRPLAPIR